MLTFTLTTLGCKVNQYDSAAMAEALATEGFQPASPGEPADLVVVNTCCVTATAMAKSRQQIRRAIRRAPHARVLLTGCYADYDPEKLAGILVQAGVPAGNYAVAGHHRPIRSALQGLLAATGTVAGFDQPLAGTDGDPTPQPTRADKEDNDCVNAPTGTRPGPGIDSTSIRTRRAAAVKSAPPPLWGISAFPGHQRAFVKIQDGCDAFCSYCIVPYSRCVLAWRPGGAVIDECRRLIQAGHREIVLCGVFLGAYGRSTARRDRWARPEEAPLADLLAGVAELPGLWRVRLSSLEPGDLTDPLLAVFGDRPTVAPHLHLPLQSGSPAILAAMNRQYTPKDFRGAVRAARSRLDRPALTTDIIVGFPGETEQHFQATLDLAAEAGFAKMHAFPFSAIAPTAAWQRRDQAPPPAVVKDRLARLAAVEEDSARQYRQQFVGQRLQALVERSGRAGQQPAAALTDRYLSVRFDRPGEAGDLRGQVVELEITATDADGLVGRLVGHRGD